MKKIYMAILLIVLFAGIAIGTKWSDYVDMGAATLDDLDTFLVRDVSDTSLAATGTQKEYPYSVMKTDLGGLFQGIDTDLTNVAALTTTAYGRALLELANEAAL